MAEFSQYNMLKEAVRAKLTQNLSQPDIEKIEKDVRSEMEAEFKKKITALAAGSNTYQKFNSGFHFSVTKSHEKKKNKALGGRCSVAICLPSPS